MSLKNTLIKVGNNVGNLIKEPSFKIAMATGALTLVTNVTVAIINNNTQKLANDTANKNLMTVKYQARMGGYDKELAEELKNMETTEGKEEKTEEPKKEG